MTHVPIDDDGSRALGVAVRILIKWGASDEQIDSILGLPHASRQGLVNLSDEQLERVSHVLNIHAALRTAFENKSNVYGFMTYPNNGRLFNGATPLSLISRGNIYDLAETARRVDALSHVW